MNIYVYIAFYAMMFILSIFSYRTKDQRKQKMFFVIMCISFFLFYGIRDESIGTDTKTYLRYYQSEDAHSYIMVEKVFYLLAKLCWTMKIPAMMYIAVLTMIEVVISAISYYYIFKNKMEYLCIAYFCMFCLPYSIMMYINVVRQGIAISFVLLGIVLLEQKRKKTAICLMILGCLFHYMTIGIVILFILLSYIKNEKILIMGSWFGAFSGAVIGITGIGKSILKNFPANRLTKRVLCYLDLPITKSQIVRLLFYMSICTIISYILVYYKKKLDNIYKWMLAILILTGIGVSCMTVSFRYCISLDIICPILFLNPKLLECIDQKNGIAWRKRYVVIYILFSVCMYFTGIISNPVRINMQF